MVLSDKVKNLIQEKFGRRIDKPSLYEALVEDIERITGERLGVNTLRRLFGEIEDVYPRLSTLNILAQYIGYASWTDLLEDGAYLLGSRLSRFPRNVLFSESVRKNHVLTINYSPNRFLKLQKIDKEDKYKVLKTNSTQLQEGDIMRIDHFMMNKPIVAKEVWRSGQLLYSYVGGEESGVNKIVDNMTRFSDEELAADGTLPIRLGR